MTKDLGSRRPALSNRSAFFGAVEIGFDRPVKSFDAIFNAVVIELQRTHGTKMKLNNVPCNGRPAPGCLPRVEPPRNFVRPPGPYRLPAFQPRNCR